MAHFAELDEQGFVLRVLVVSNNDAPDPAPSNSEPFGIAFLESLGLGANWKQTSYSGSFRSKYAGIGDFYDPVLDIFTSGS